MTERQTLSKFLPFGLYLDLMSVIKDFLASTFSNNSHTTSEIFKINSQSLNVLLTLDDIFESISLVSYLNAKI